MWSPEVSRQKSCAHATCSVNNQIHSLMVAWFTSITMKAGQHSLCFVLDVGRWVHFVLSAICGLHLCWIWLLAFRIKWHELWICNQISGAQVHTNVQMHAGTNAVPDPGGKVENIRPWRSWKDLGNKFCYFNLFNLSSLNWNILLYSVLFECKPSILL